VLSELGSLKRGTLAIEASLTIAGYWLPRHLVAFRRAFPQIDIRLAIGNTAQVAAAVRKGDVELGFVEGAVDDPALANTILARDQMELVVGPAHDWADIERLAPGRLAETEWVMREPGSGTRSVFEAALEGFGLSLRDLKIALELPTNEAVRAAVEAGIGATALSASVVAPSLEAGLLHRVRLDLPERTFSVLHHRERYRSSAAEALLQLIDSKGRRRPF
jgi:DNA-binding transcriptional LysR family regulator